MRNRNLTDLGWSFIMDNNNNDADFVIGVTITLSDTAENPVATFDSSYLTDKTISLIMRDVGNSLSNNLIKKLNRIHDE